MFLIQSTRSIEPCSFPIRPENIHNNSLYTVLICHRTAIAHSTARQENRTEHHQSFTAHSTDVLFFWWSPTLSLLVCFAQKEYDPGTCTPCPSMQPLIRLPRPSDPKVSRGGPRRALQIQPCRCTRQQNGSDRQPWAPPWANPGTGQKKR
jgi:hypothetical protein